VKAFHELLSEQMDRAGITPQALAECADVNLATAYKWRNGDVAPRPWRIEKIAECVGLDPVKLARSLYLEAAQRIATEKPPSMAELVHRIEALEEQVRNLSGGNQ
jgi:Cro/C1-type HTH DNA-binding domain